MVGPKVVVYGLCTEGYDLACTMVLKGAQVHVVDESNQSAMLLTQDIAKTYPNISSIKDDEMILPLVPIKEAVSKAYFSRHAYETVHSNFFWRGNRKYFTLRA